MRTPFEIVVLGCVMWLIVAGCTSTIHQFSREGPDPDSSNIDLAFQHEVSECQRAIVHESHVEAMMGTAHVTFFDRDMNRCLAAKGWTPTPTGSHAYRFDEWMREAVVVK